MHLKSARLLPSLFLRKLFFTLWKFFNYTCSFWNTALQNIRVTSINQVIKEVVWVDLPIMQVEIWEGTYTCLFLIIFLLLGSLWIVYILVIQHAEVWKEYRKDIIGMQLILLYSYVYNWLWFYSMRILF